MTDQITWTFDIFGFVSDCFALHVEEEIPHGTWLVRDKTRSGMRIASFHTQMGAMAFGQLLRDNPDVSIPLLLEREMAEHPISQDEIDARDADFDKLLAEHYAA